MTVDEIRELISLASETGIAEFEVQRGDNRVRIRRGGSFASPQEIVVSPGYAAPPPRAGSPGAPAGAPGAGRWKPASPRAKSRPIPTWSW